MSKTRILILGGGFAGLYGSPATFRSRVGQSYRQEGEGR